MDQFPGKLTKIYCRTIAQGVFYNVWGIQFHSIENRTAHIFLLINRRKSKHYFNILLRWLHHWAIIITCWETVGDSSMTNDLQESA